MAKYRLNDGYDDERDVTAESFLTNGDFVDFVDVEGVTVLRVRANRVHSVELTEGL